MKFDVLLRILCLGILPLGSTFSAAADWNQWRGPSRDGVASGFTLPSRWTPSALERKWSVAVGEGHSSPLIVGDHVYVFAREGEQEILRCLRLTDGQTLWRQAYAAPYEMNPAARNHGKGPKATPAVADGRVFTLGINGQLSAFDARTGASLWRKEFGGVFKSTAPLYGAAASPLVDGKSVVVHVGGENSGALTAFDVATGKVIWQWTGDGPAYTSPIIATLGGIRQLVTQSQEHCVAVSPDDGRLLWKIPFTTPYDQNIVTPVIAGDLVIFAGIQKPTFAVRVTGTDPKPAWETREITMYMSSPVLSGKTLFGMSDKQRGMLFALNATDGAVQWKSEGRLGANASLIDVGPVLLVMTDDGELLVQEKVGHALKELARYKLAPSQVWAAPAVARDHIVIKDRTNLIAHRVRRD